MLGNDIKELIEDNTTGQKYFGKMQDKNAYDWLAVSMAYSSPQSKNAVSTFQITFRVLSFWSDEQTLNPLP